jgi:DNA modification methylase
MKKEVANNTWNIAPVPHNSDIEHPCPLPEEIAHRLTLLYSCPGDAVIDPFSGSGTVPTVADQLGRVGIGTELNPAFAADARCRLRDGTYTRNDQLLPRFESIDGESPQTRIRKPDTNGDTSTTQSSLTGF